MKEKREKNRWRGFIVCAKLKPNSRGQSKLVELSRPYSSRKAAQDFLELVQRQRVNGMRDYEDVYIVESVRG